MQKLTVAVAALGVTLGAWAKDYTPDIVDGKIVFGEITEDSTITIASGETVTSSTAITGSSKLSVGGGGTLVLSAASTGYSGEIHVGNATVKVTTGSALGMGNVTVEGCGTNGQISRLWFDVQDANATIPNDITFESEVETQAGLVFVFKTAKEIHFTGDIVARAALSMTYSRVDTTSNSSYSTKRFFFEGAVDVNGALEILGQYGYVFSGPLKATYVYLHADASTPNNIPYIYLNTTDVDVGYFMTRKTGRVVAMVENCFGNAGFRNNDSSASGGLGISTYDQKLAYLDGTDNTKKSCGIFADATTGATLTLTGGGSDTAVTRAASTRLALSGKLNLVVDQTGTGAYTQTIYGTNTMSGTIAVKKGTLNLSGVALFRNVPEITVSGGALNLDSKETGAFAGLTSLTVSGGAFTVSAATVDALPNDGSLVLSLTTGSGAQLNLPSGTTLVVDQFIVDGQQMVRGTPFTHADYEEIAEGVEISAVGHYTCTESGNIDLASLLGGASGGCKLTIPEGITVTNTTAMPATGGVLSILGGGTLALGVESPDYAGAVDIAATTIIIPVSNPFGTGSMTIDGLTLLKFVGENPKTFPNELTVVNSTVDSVVINNTGKGCVTFESAITATGGVGINSIRGVSGATFSDVSYLVFEKEITCSSGSDIRFQMQGAAELHGTVTASTLSAYGGGSSPTLSAPILHLYATNSIGRIYTRWSGKFICEAEGLFAGKTYLEYNNGENAGNLDLGHFDQKIRFVTGAGKASKLVSISASAEGATLTLSGQGVRSVTNCRLTGGLGLTVDSSDGSLSQTFAGSIEVPHTMTGPITVKSGAVTFANETTLVNVPMITVEGGALKLTTTAGGAFASVTNLTVSGGTFTIDGTGADPFGALASTKTVASLSDNGTLALGDGVTAAVYRACTNGVYLEAGEYTGSDSTANATRLPQLSGNGILKVKRSGPGGIVLIVR